MGNAAPNLSPILDEYSSSFDQNNREPSLDFKSTFLTSLL